MSHNRFRDSEELRYSLRSLEKYAPWIRKIFLVTDNQVPYWLNLENSRIQIVPHTEIFPNKSHLPVFSSPAIESHIHRIKGLSKKFIYFNDDVFLGAPTYPEDFYFIGGAQRLYQAWDVPKCAPGCSDSWIGDGYCDKACNVSSCNYDFPDCVNGTTGNQRGRGNTLPSKEAFFCATGCPDSWLGDKVCDQKCKTIECGWDAGDCGVDLIVEDFAGVTPLEVDYSNITIQKQRHQSFEVLQNLQQYTNPSISNILHPQYDHSSAPANQSDILFPVVLTVPYGSYAAYVNLSYFPCSALQIPSPLRVPNQKIFPFSAAFSPTCSEHDIVSPFGPLGGPVGHYRSKVSEIPTWTNFTYTSMNYTIVPVKRFNNSSDLNEEDLKEIENAVSFSILIIKHNLLMILLRGHDKEFSDSGTPKKVFNYRDPLDVRFNISGYNIVTGINVTSLFTIRLVSVHPDVEEDHSIPEGMNLIDGISSSCIDPKQSSDRDILHLTSLYHHRSPFQSEDNSRQGIVVSLSIAGLSSQLYYTPLSKIHSLITITLLSGELYRHQYDLCESLGLVTPFQRTIKRNFLGSVPICENSILLGDLFYPRGNSVETAEPIDLLLPVPISWSTFPVNASGVGFPLHATLELFVSNSTSLISKSYLNTTDSPENRILCFTGSFRWGTRKILENLEIFLNVTNGTALTNTTTNSTNATVPITETQTEQVIEKVDTYASSLRHVNSLYHKVGRQSLFQGHRF